MPTIREKLAICFYGKTKKEEDALFKSFGGTVRRTELRRFSWLPRFF